ncbi:MAG: BatD family protein [bacterium]|nr:BatD family protein [bacterium]
MRRLLALLALLVVAAAAPARAAVTLSARLEPSRAAVGDPVDLAVTVNGAQDAPVPTLTPPDGLSIRYVGPETQVSIVNGQMTSSITHHYTVVAQREGLFSVGPITLDYEGTKLGAGSPRLTVTASPTGGPTGGEQLRLVLEAPKTTVYLHERLPLGLSLWVGDTSVGDLQYPVIGGDGFALDPFREPSQRSVRTADGAFQLVDFTTTLVPLRVGTLSVGPATMSLAQVMQRPRRGFFLGGSGRQPIELRSEAITLEVLPLPEAGRPADFGGAVGRFSLDVAAAPRDLAAGDPVTLTITVRGTGTLEGAATPAVAERPGLKVYPVQAAAQQPATTPGEITRVFEQVVIPQQPGTVTLPPVRLAYFDPEARAYRVAQHGPIVLAVVHPAPGTPTPQVVGAAARPAPAVATPEPLGRDLVFIKDAPGALVPAAAARWRRPAFWLLQLVPPLVWVAVMLWTARRQRLGSDARFARFSAAGRTARTSLAAARTRLQGGDRAGCVDAVAQAVTAYLSAKLDLPPGSVDPERAGERLRGTRAGGAVVDDLRTLLATCERVRFAPGSSADGEAERALGQAEGIVRTLERERRLGRGFGATAASCLVALGLGLAGPAPAADETPQAAFFRGNALYADGRFAEAADAYAQVLAAGVESGPTYYNLGNARLRAGDAGGAVWAYARAPAAAARRRRRREPRLRAGAGHGAAAGAPVGARGLPLADVATADELAGAAAVAWWLLFGLLVAARLVPGARRGLRRAAFAVGLAGLVVLLSFGWRLATVDLRAEAVVVAPAAVSVRFEPSATGTSHFTAAPGSVLRVLGAREGWRQVARGDGARGWVEASALADL